MSESRFSLHSGHKLLPCAIGEQLVSGRRTVAEKRSFYGKSGTPVTLGSLPCLGKLTLVQEDEI